MPRSCLGLCESDWAPSAFLKEQNSQTQLVIAQGKHILQASILNARFFTGLRKVKTGSHFFPIVPGVSMRMDTEINPGSTCIEGKLFGGSEAKYKKMHFTVKHSNLEPIDADCKSLMFWKILEAE